MFLVYKTDPVTFLDTVCRFGRVHIQAAFETHMVIRLQESFSPPSSPSFIYLFIFFRPWLFSYLLPLCLFIHPACLEYWPVCFDLTQVDLLLIYLQWKAKQKKNNMKRSQKEAEMSADWIVKYLRIIY